MHSAFLSFCPDLRRMFLPYRPIRLETEVKPQHAFLFLFGIASISATANSQGISWQEMGLSNVGSINALTLSAHGVVAGTDAAGVFLSSDGGSSWTEINSGLANLHIRSLSVDSSGMFFCGTQGSGIFLSTNGGTGWTQTNMPTLWTIRALASKSHALVFAGTSGGGMFRSTNAGVSWDHADSGLTDPFVRVVAVSPSGTLFAGTASAGVFRSTDDGDSWELTGIQPDWEYRALAITDDGTVFAGSLGNGVFRSTNSGADWIQVNQGLSNLTVEYLGVNRVGHVFAATRFGGIFRSADNGDTWLEVNSGLTNLDVRCLAADGADMMYAGTAMGVFRSSGPTSVMGSAPLPAAIPLEQNYPNPFNPTTTIRYELLKEARVELKVYNILGQEVMALVNETQKAGRYSADFGGERFASGVYFYGLRAGEFVTTRKMLLLK
jgi:hypothetical protein